MSKAIQELKFSDQVQSQIQLQNYDDTCPEVLVDPDVVVNAPDVLKGTQSVLFFNQGYTEPEKQQPSANAEEGGSAEKMGDGTGQK